MSSNRKNIFIFILILSFVFISASSIIAASPDAGLSEAARMAGISSDNGNSTATKEPGYIVAEIIQFILSFLGIIFFLLTIYGGFLWMTARGAQDQVGKAKKIIVDSIIGIVIILLAYVISNLVVSALIKAV